jgi:hypothetical protein
VFSFEGVEHTSLDRRGEQYPWLEPTSSVENV